MTRDICISAWLAAWFVAMGFSLVFEAYMFGLVAFWSLMPGFFLIHQFARLTSASKKEMSQEISFGESIRSKNLWLKYAKVWALPFACMLYLFPKFLEVGVPLIVVVGLGAINFVAQVDSCRRELYQTRAQ
ncbi:hypothetical protein [Ruegeria faecimaris]|uniref:hypothetical protein n=1 Tax=Ruegeria faecimaris TaxID=686389 RepID=UPI00249225B0|nr:hypothetical protein [Ruegeria faecimaris]